VSLPDPEPGLIVRYDYLWPQEAKNGIEHGKDRPACLVAAIDRPGQALVVVLLPITHTPPSGEVAGIEIPAKTKRLLELDDAPSWIIVSDHNLDVWPTPGLSPVPGKPGRFAYGFIPPSLFAQVKSKFMELVRQKKTQSVRRDEPRGTMSESTGLESQYRTKEERRRKVRGEITRRNGKSKPKGRR
jgi:hypothetical protein